jgi:hypothetical protein
MAGALATSHAHKLHTRTTVVLQIINQQRSARGVYTTHVLPGSAGDPSKVNSITHQGKQGQNTIEVLHPRLFIGARGARGY